MTTLLDRFNTEMAHSCKLSECDDKRTMRAQSVSCRALRLARGGESDVKKGAGLTNSMHFRF